MMLSLLKWVVPAILIVVIAAALLTKKTFHVERVISAPPEAIWDVLVDTENYSEWNPVFVAVAGQYKEGAMVRNSVLFPDGSITEMEATVRTLANARELRQFGGTWGLMTFDHRWQLEPVEGGTRVVQYEIDRGLVLWFWNSDWIEPAYQTVLDGLEQRVNRESASAYPHIALGGGR